MFWSEEEGFGLVWNGFEWCWGRRGIWQSQPAPPSFAGLACLPQQSHVEQRHTQMSRWRWKHMLKDFNVSQHKWHHDITLETRVNWEYILTDWELILRRIYLGRRKTPPKELPPGVGSDLTGVSKRKWPKRAMHWIMLRFDGEEVIGGGLEFP